MSLKILLIVNLLVILNLRLMIYRIWVLISIGSGLQTPHESYLEELLLTQSEKSNDNNDHKIIIIMIMNITKNEIDIFLISETKIDNSFPISQFTMTAYSIPFRLDRTSHVGGILLSDCNGIRTHNHLVR